MSASPLVSVLLVTYQQRPWIEQALHSIMEQTYNNIEIIVADDASTDGTFEALSKIAQDGIRRSITLHRQAKNVGLARNLQSAAARARGELCVYAAGDDLSAPHRVERLVQAWTNNGTKQALLYSDYTIIDAAGRNLGPPAASPARRAEAATLRELATGNHFIYGCTSAYSQGIMRDFPPLLDNLIHEDCITLFRARLSGSAVIHVPETLVHYRNTGLTSGYSTRPSREDAAKQFSRWATDYEQKANDAESHGRRDLARLSRKRRDDYVFATMCADERVPMSALAETALRAPPNVSFALRQILKFRAGPLSKLIASR